MFIIYYSNDLLILKKILSYQIKQHIYTNIFTEENIIIINTNNGMKEWLQIHLAEDLGIFLNNNLLFIDNFFMILANKLFNNFTIKSTLDKYNIFWKLLYLIPNLIQQNQLKQFYKYYHKTIDDPLKFIHLCYQISNIYDQYLLYRIDWLMKWEKGKLVHNLRENFHQKWQAFLWKAILTSLKNSRKIYLRHQMYHLLMQNLNKLTPTQLSLLPKRIFIFNILHLPSIYWKILSILSNHIEIHYFMLNPCKNYWIEDYYNPTNSHVSNNNFFYSCNNLLYKFGKTIKNTLSNLLQLESVDFKSFYTPNQDNLLNLIKIDILESDIKCFIPENVYKENMEYIFYEPINKLCKKKIPISRLDNTIIINICSTIQHEVQVLYDYLSKLINNKQTTIEPKNILVMVSDLSLYANAIKGIFHSLPYNISYFKTLEFNILVNTFLNILKLPQTEYKLDTVISILEISYIRNQFKITSEEIQLIYKWLKNSGIKKGLNKKQLTKLNLYEINSLYTWEVLLQRIFLGYVGCKKQKNIIPYYPVRGLSYEVIGKIYNFIMLINKWYFKLSFKYSFNTWKKHILNLYKDFFIIQPFQEHDIIIKLNRLLYSAFTLNNEFTSKGKFSLEEVIYYLYNFLNKKEQYMLDIQNGITFCSFHHMRSIPFKVICMLGMNVNFFTSSTHKLTFDLISRNKKKGDLNQLDEHNSIFLETILAAEEQLYISYVGNNYEHSPAHVVNELLEYIKEKFYILDNDNNNVSITTKLMNFYDQRNYLLSNLQNLNNKLLDTPAIIYKQSNQDINYIDWTKFINFWKHPIKEYCILNLRSKLATLANGKSHNKYIYDMRRQIFNQYLKNKKLDDIFSYYHNNRILPEGNSGILIWKKQQDLIFKLFSNIKKHFIPHEFSNYEYNFNITLNGRKIFGILQNVTTTNLVKLKLSTLNFIDYLILYLEHLLINLLLGEKTSILYGIGNQKFVLPPIHRRQSKNILQQYVDGYFTGLKIPLFLPPRTTVTILKFICNKPSSSWFYFDLIDRVLKGDKDYPGELLEDVYIKQIFFIDNNIYSNYVHLLLNNIKQWFNPICPPVIS